MDIEHYLVRAIGAVAFAAAAFAGLVLVGAGFGVVVAISALIGVLQTLNVLTSFARGSAALILVWGALTYAGITPGAKSLVWAKQQMTDMARPQGDANNKANKSDNFDSAIAKKLESLRTLCEKRILDPGQCEAARNKIYADRDQ